MKINNNEKQKKLSLRLFFFEQIISKIVNDNKCFDITITVAR